MVSTWNAKMLPYFDDSFENLGEYLYVNMHQTIFEVAVRVLYGWIFPNHTHIMHFLDSPPLSIFPGISQNPYSPPVYISFDNREWIPIENRLQIQVTRLVGCLHLICYHLFRPSLSRSRGSIHTLCSRTNFLIVF